jgi:hypothetical protein
LILSLGGRGVDCSGVIIKLNSVQLQLQLPAGTELGKMLHPNNQVGEKVTLSLIPSIYLYNFSKSAQLRFLLYQSQVPYYGM